MGKYVKDIIGDEYLKWKDNTDKRVIINSHTASGKTTFVFETLLPDAIRNGKTIVYLCNRNALKEQLKKEKYEGTIEVDGKPYNVFDYIYIVSYQYCETVKSFPDFDIDINNLLSLEPEMYCKKSKVAIRSRDVLYYVFDEAHYFIADSTYNEKASFWYNQKLKSKHSTYVFMTATPESLYLFFHYKDALTFEDVLNQFIFAKNREYELIEKLFYLDEFYTLNYEEQVKQLEEEIAKCNWTNIFLKLQESLNDLIGNFSKYNDEFYFYEQDKSYDDYECFYFSQYENLTSRIIKSDEKWLVFVDSKDDGRYLQKRLNQQYQKASKKNPKAYKKFATFISSNSVKREKSRAKQEFDMLTDTEQFESRVLIATSVLDNGINIKDIAVNNIVIAQANKSEFIQMIGRLRKEPKQKVNLFIKCLCYNKINALSTQAKENIINTIIFECFYRSKFRYNQDWEVIQRVNQTAEFDKKRNELLSTINKNRIPNIFIFPPVERDNFYKASEKIDVLENITINKSVFIDSLYSLYLYTNAVMHNEEEKQPQNFYLKKQLEWLNKSYDERKWVEYIDAITQISAIIEENENKEYMERNEYIDFKTKVLTYALSLPEEWASEKVLKNRSRYVEDKEREPSLKTINSILSGLKIPYKLCSKVVYAKERRTVWYLSKNAIK